MTRNTENSNFANQFPHQAPDHQAVDLSASEAEHTLRLVAELPPPSELTERVHQRLSEARGLQPRPRLRPGFWSFWLPAQRLQFAGAALLVVAFASSTWSVYHTRISKPASGRPVSSAPGGLIAPQSPGPNGGFGSAAADRRPSTLTPIKVPPVTRKKPSASHAANKPKAALTQSGLQTTPGQNAGSSPTEP